MTPIRCSSCVSAAANRLAQSGGPASPSASIEVCRERASTRSEALQVLRSKLGGATLSAGEQFRALSVFEAHQCGIHRIHAGTGHEAEVGAPVSASTHGQLGLARGLRPLKEGDQRGGFAGETSLYWAGTGSAGGSSTVSGSRCMPLTRYS
jgi:hypothetical protein